MTLGLRRADARANHAALLEAALALVGGGPSEDVPYDDLAAAAGVSRATVYRHFPTREALFAAILEASLEDWEAIAGTLAPGPERFAALFDAWILWQREKPPLLEVIVRRAPEAERLRLQRRLEVVLEEPVREAQSCGAISRRLSVSDVRVTLSMLSSVVRSGTPGDRRRAVALAHAMLFAGEADAATSARVRASPAA